MIFWTEWKWIMKVQEFSGSIRKYKCLCAYTATATLDEQWLSY